jgi:hypothetical protein
MVRFVTSPRTSFGTTRGLPVDRNTFAETMRETIAPPLVPLGIGTAATRPSGDSPWPKLGTASAAVVQELQEDRQERAHEERATDSRARASTVIASLYTTP